MKQYLAVFMGSENSRRGKEWDSLDEATRAKREEKGMTAWGQWVQEHQKAIVVPGSPLGTTRLVNEQGISKTTNGLCAYVVVQAKSHDEAARMFINHPHFTLFPGDSVEVMECLEIPGAGG